VARVVARGVEPALLCVTGARAAIAATRSPRLWTGRVDLLPRSGVGRLKVHRGGEPLVQGRLPRTGEDHEFWINPCALAVCGDGLHEVRVSGWMAASRRVDTVIGGVCGGVTV
jgi:hypothetical protein